MPFPPPLRRSDLARNLGVFAAYLLLARIGLYFTQEPVSITIFWPAGGFALAVLLLGGPRYLPGIAAGAVVAGFMAVEHRWAAVMLGIADTAESLFAWWLLTRQLQFDRDLSRRQDFFRLTLLAGPAAAMLATLIGPTALLATGVIDAGHYPQVAMRWWMGDVLGIALLTPLLLFWRKPPRRLQGLLSVEAAALLALAFLAGQAVFAGWLDDHLTTPLSVAWVAPFIVWAGLRLGRHVTSLVVLMLILQALWSAGGHTGIFAHDLSQTGLFNLWMFGMAISVVGPALAVISAEGLQVQQEWRRLHQAMASSLNEIYLFQADTLRFFFVNRGAVENLGYSMEELKSLTPLDLKPEFTPQAFAQLLEPLRRGQVTVQVFETVHLRKDGTRYPVEVHLQLFDNAQERYFQAVVLDISRRREAEKELRLAAQVFENSNDGIEITDAQRHIVSVNRAFSRISGYSEAEVVGRKPSILSSGVHDAGFYRAIDDTLERDGRWQGEIWNRRKNGEIYPETLSISTVRDANGNIVNYIGVFSDISERKAAENSLRHQAQHDFLTNLPNRTLLHDRFLQLLARARRNGEQFALLYLDLDNFKPVNDQHSHHVGDLLLQAVAERLGGAMRQTDTICRLGGDEFAILTPGTGSEQEAQALAAKLRTVIEAPYQVAGLELRLTVSIGVALYPQHGTDEQSLMAHADAAMYQAKQLNHAAARQAE